MPTRTRSADAEVTPEQTVGFSLCPLLVHGLPLAGHLERAVILWGARYLLQLCQNQIFLPFRQMGKSQSQMGKSQSQMSTTHSRKLISSDITSIDDAFILRIVQEGHVWSNVNVPLNLSKTTTPALAELLSLCRQEGAWFAVP